MKIAMQYVNDVNGTTQAIQMPLSEWEKVLKKIKKYEQALRLKADLKDALEQVAALKISKQGKQTLTEFLNEI